jgi:hypothetical protein
MADTPTNPPAANSNAPTTSTTPPAGGAPTSGTPASTAPPSEAPPEAVNESPYEDPGCGSANSDGSPSFMDGEGGAPTSTEPGQPVPAAPGVRTNTNVDFKGQTLPPIPSSGNFNNMGNFKLSHFYTLHQALHPALGASAIGARNIGGQRFSARQVLQNLRDLFVLCIDPIRERFGPRFIITSTLRNNSNGSAHNVGWAADMQFGGCGYVGGKHRDVANIIAGLRIPYDQLLYEHAPSRCNGPWVHVGLRRPATLEVRGWAQSFYEDRPYGAKGRFDQMPGLRG